MTALAATPAKIADYALIGDCRSAALVSRAASIDWLCWPRFDSSAIFSAILDLERGGFWSLAPIELTSTTREYIGASNVLATKFQTQAGSATLTDLMPVVAETYKKDHLLAEHELIRRLECTRGEIAIEMRFAPRRDYGKLPVHIRDLGALGLRFDVGRGSYYLRSNQRLQSSKHFVEFRTTLREGECLEFSLSYSENAPAVLPSLGSELARRIERSIQWWQQWAERCTYRGPYRDIVVRSALALKLLAYSPSGALIAAPTTSLPERIGDTLNWDYRYCWLRDASFIVRSLLGVGYREEAESFLNWLLIATRLTHPALRVLYNVYGGNAPRERSLRHLSGYFDSRPVRVGNGARDQRQLDVYGEVLDAVWHFVQSGGELDRTMQNALIGFGKEVVESWREPDEGIWEPRYGRRQNTYSKLMCWTALDRLVRLREGGHLDKAPIDRFRRERERIRTAISDCGWNDHLESYVSILHGDHLDATLLLLPWYDFEAADSPRMKSTYRRVLQELGAGDGLLYRYRREPPEGAFGLCSFWHTEYLALGGASLAEARREFEAALRYQNDLGLFAEEIAPATGEALGNFPQGFTHVGVISAALAIKERAAREKGESQAA